MQASFIKLLLLSIASFSFMMVFPQPLAASRDNLILLEDHGTLFFTFTPNFFPTARGKFRLIVSTPDKKVFKGSEITIPIIPVLPITIAVKHPIFFGEYTVAVENISGTNFLSTTPDLINGFVTVNNSFNAKSIDVAITSTTTNDPGLIQEGYFTPTPSFVFEKTLKKGEL